MKNSNQWRPRVTILAAAVGVALSSSAVARAHFVLVEPASFAEQDSLGSPQKSLPCGQADPGQPAQMTGEVTTFTQGQTIKITIDETIYHPGHYRVSIAPDQSGIPNDPPVTAGSTACGSTVISDNPQLPLIADGLLPHSKPFSDPQTVEIKLPADFTCTNCTLQIAQFMSEHGLNNPGGCFYHHCATVSIVPAGSASSGAGGSGSTAASSSSGSGSGGNGGSGGAEDDGKDDSSNRASDTGCGCRIADANSPALASVVGLFALGALLRRRRR